MLLNEYVEDIKLALTSGVLELEITDETIGQIVNRTLKEVQRYIDETRLIQVPFASCIDLSTYTDKDGKEHEFKYTSITSVYRCDPIGDSGKGNGGISTVDPAYAQMWLAYSNGNTMYNLNNYLMNYMTYNTLLQIRNTTSTDLAFKEDPREKKLYINVASGRPSQIVIEYIPRFEDVSEITLPYWEDILYRMSLAQTKLALGRVRTFAKQTNALYTLDGDTLLEEGNRELSELREILRTNSSLFYPID